MKKGASIGLGVLPMLLLLGGGSRADEQCVGDCDGDRVVAINELITGVNISLGNLDVDECLAFDENGNGAVSINELIKGVNINLSGGCPPDAFCGNNAVDVDGEECDDGGLCVGTIESGNATACQSNEDCGSDGPCKTFGGDGCAKNCTFETGRLAEFDPLRTIATVQTAALPLLVFLQGVQTLTTGSGRDETVIGPSGEDITKPDELPVVVEFDSVNFPPAIVPGLVCACVRVLHTPDLFGPGNGADGVIGCGLEGLTDINYRLVQDHNTSPTAFCRAGDDICAPCETDADCGGGEGSCHDGNCREPCGSDADCSGEGVTRGCYDGKCSGLPDDPECDNELVFPSGFLSTACVEQEGERCSDLEDEHPCVCRSPRVIELSGGAAPRGSALINYSISIGLLRDGGICAECRKSDGQCCFAQYGPDCLPCTDDDGDLGDVENLVFTTGHGEAAVFDANNEACVIIDKDQSCLGLPCITEVEGFKFDCGALAANPTGGVEDSGLGVIFPAIDSATIGDNVTSVVLFQKDVSP